MPLSFGKPCAAALDGMVPSHSQERIETRFGDVTLLFRDLRDKVLRKINFFQKNRGFSGLSSGLTPSRKAPARQDGVASPGVPMH